MSKVSTQIILESSRDIEVFIVMILKRWTT